ncbi:MAG: hypothetical protein CL484_12050 [Acidobacteria bacterium]|nr:hypothetical protein [Acidobacteriota bacterium]
MAKVVQKRREPLELGLSGLAGAMEGATESEQININRRLQERDLARQEAALSEQVRSNDMQSSIAVRQLEILQSEGKLNRDQEARLQELMESGRTSRHESGLAQSEVESARRAKTQERGQDIQERTAKMQDATSRYGIGTRARTAERGQTLGYQADIYRTDTGRQTALDQIEANVSVAEMQDRTTRYRSNLQDTQFNTNLSFQREALMDNRRRVDDINYVLDSFEGDWTSLSQVQRSQAAEQLAVRRVGPQRWAGSGGAQPASDQEKMEATEQAARDLANRDRIQETVFQQEINVAQALAASRDGDTRGMNISMNRQPISPDSLFSIPDDGGPSTLNYDSIEERYGVGGVSIVTGIEDMLEQQISELAGTGVGPVGHNRDVQMATLNNNVSSVLLQWDIPEQNKEDLMAWVESNFVVAMEAADMAAQEAALEAAAGE